MKFTAEQIAGILEGEVVGNPNAEVSRLSKIEEGTEGSLTFLANPKYINFIYETKATITIVNNTFVPENKISTTLIKVEDAYKSFSKLLEFYNQIKLNKVGIEVPCVLSESAKHGENFYLGSFSYIGENVIDEVFVFLFLKDLCEQRNIILHIEIIAGCIVFQLFKNHLHLARNGIIQFRE